MDIEYKIDESFQCMNNTIFIGGNGYNKLKEHEQNTFICDALTHEFIHVLLNNMFNITVSSLFDFIGDSLLHKKILKKAINFTPNNSLWCDAVKENGNKVIYNTYLIDNIDLIQAFIITGGRYK